MNVNPKIGLRPIPGFSNYLVSETGLVCSAKYTRQISFPKENGTFVYRLKSDNGVWTLVPRHEAIGLAYLQHPKCAKYLVYKNNTFGDDRVDNLEWLPYDLYCKKMNFTLVESPKLPGYYEFPKHYNRVELEDYVISPSGDLVYLPDLIHEKVQYSSSGYYYFSIYRKLGRRIMLQRHRLVCMVFKPRTDDISSLQVNHINGIKGDDRVENLEWCSPRENTLLAGFQNLSPKCRPVQVRDTKTGVVVTYFSATEAAKHMGFAHRDSIIDRAKTNGQQIFDHHYQYRFYNEDNDEWIDATVINSGSRARPLIVRALVNDSVKTFKDMTSCCVFLDIPISTLCAWMLRIDQPVVPGKNGNYQVKFADDDNPWRPITDELMELSRTTRGKPVQAINTITGKIETYLSVAACAAARGLLTTTLCNRLHQSPEIVYKDGYRYRYYPIQF